MRQWNNQKTRGDRGRASIEFLVFALFGLVPMVWGVQSLWAIQGAAIATEQASRDALRAFVQNTNVALARSQAETIARRVVSEHGVIAPVDIDVTCASGCLSPGGFVEIRVSTAVTVWRPPVWPESWPGEVGVSGTSSARVSQYGGSG